MKTEAKDSLTVIGYNYPGYPFGNSYAGQRFSYYGIGGTPYMKFDGVWTIAGGGSNNYNQYRNAFNSRKVVAPKVEITLLGDYDIGTGQGWAKAYLKNVTTSALTGYIHFIICQRDTPYAWAWLDSVQYIERGMYPNATGCYVTIDPNQTVSDSHSFTVQASWLRNNCYLTVFFQNSSTKEIAQAAEESLQNLSVAEEENANLNLFRIGPNPASSYLMVSLNCRNATVDIIDCTGAIRKTKTTTKDNLKIPLSNLSSGIYFCRVKAEEGTQTRKFIKF